MSISATAKVFHGPWEGTSKIAIGIDIGTTQSGVAFAFLQQGKFGFGALVLTQCNLFLHITKSTDTGAEQTIHRVTQWPGQESQNLHGKIPTVVWYDTDNKAVSFGAEALSPQAEEEAEDNNWRMAKYFKLHLHPSDLTNKHRLHLRPLPTGVTLPQIYADFLGYLLHHTQLYFEDHILDGKRIWKTYVPSLDVIIAHPNGWGIREQTFLRLAVVKAGFTSAADANTKVHFVSEAEASVHFCMFHTNLGDQLNPGATFAVCDAGGSTVDTTVYSVNSTSPLRLEETRASDCVQAGAIFIDEEAKDYLFKVLRNAELSPEDVEEYVTHGVRNFENSAKRAFRDAVVDQTIEIAGTRLVNPTIRVRRGRMTVPGLTIKSFFDPWISQIVSSVETQIESASVSYILLVGGFGESLYLREQLKERFEPKGCHVTTTSDGTSKAVADGAIIWFSSNRVVKRAPRFSFGVEVLVPHNPQLPAQRNRKTVLWPSGRYTKGGWSQIVAKSVPIDCDTVTRRAYSREYSSDSSNLESFSTVLWGYSLAGTPEWMRFKTGRLMPGFQQVCTVKADLNVLRNAFQIVNAPNGVPYRVLKFSVCIHFGRTELKAFLEWVENRLATLTG